MVSTACERDAPEAPEAPFLLEKTTRSITFGWKRPADNGAKITAHTLVFGRLNATQVRGVDGARAGSHR